MKKGIAIVFALGAVAGFVAYRAFKNIKEELESTMPMDQDDFGDPVVQDHCECGGDCQCGAGECECHATGVDPVPKEADS